MISADEFKPYSKRSVSEKQTIRNRIVSILENCSIDRVETTIAPPEVVAELWEEHSFYKDYRNFKLEFLHSSVAGCHFRVVRKI